MGTVRRTAEARDRAADVLRPRRDRRLADRGGDRAPYLSVQRLWSWTRDEWNFIDGRLAVAGHAAGADSLSFRRLLNVTYALLTEGMSPESRAAFDEMLAAKADVEARGPSREVVQNREFLRELRGIGVPVPVIQ